MAAQVKILVAGYSNANSTANIADEKTRPTITLVKDGRVVMVVDPGTLESQQILVDTLEKEGLGINDVNYVCITHSHIDHYRNIGMFPNAKTLEYYGVWDKESVEPWPENFSENIQIIATPGHDSTSISLLVKTDDGIAAICGDVFWRKDYPKDPYGDTYADNYDKLKESREMILKMADWVIPGHGPVYRAKEVDADEPDKEQAETVKLKDNLKENARCKKCGRIASRAEMCLCRPWICFRCCGCDIDCKLCSCAHKK